MLFKFVSFLLLILLSAILYPCSDAFIVTPSAGVLSTSTSISTPGPRKKSSETIQSWSFSRLYSSPNDHENERSDINDEDTFNSLEASQVKWLQERSNNNPQQGRDRNRQRQLEEEEEAEQDAAEKLSGNVNIPKTGISISDEMLSFQTSEKFVTQIVPLEKNGVAALQTVTMNTVSDEPLRYLVPLRPYSKQQNLTESKDPMVNNNHSSGELKRYAMIDVPPYSDDLASNMKSFMGENASLTHILVTSRNGIHYDEAPAVYVTRKSDMEAWKKAFPNVKIVVYRLDIPRDCKGSVSQVLDGYGPWALEGDNNHEDEDGTTLFRETGRPLTTMVWDEAIQARVLDKGEAPPDDDDDENDYNSKDDHLYTPQAIREREEGKEILAVYTPGHTYGSMTYIFPQSKVCCSGCTIPVEDTIPSDYATGLGIPKGVGPRLDYSGYLTTNTGGIERQVASGRHIASVYADRFDIVLPARGPPINLGNFDLDERSRILHGILNDFAEVGRVYSSLGIL